MDLFWTIGITDWKKTWRENGQWRVANMFDISENLVILNGKRSEKVVVVLYKVLFDLLSKFWKLAEWICCVLSWSIFFQFDIVIFLFCTTYHLRLKICKWWSHKWIVIVVFQYSVSDEFSFFTPKHYNFEVIKEM